MNDYRHQDIESGEPAETSHDAIMLRLLGDVLRVLFVLAAAAFLFYGAMQIADCAGCFMP